MSLDKFK